LLVSDRNSLTLTLSDIQLEILSIVVDEKYFNVS